MRILPSGGSVFGGIMLGLITEAVATFIGVLAYSYLFTPADYRYGAIVWLSFYGVPIGALVGSVVGFVARMTHVANPEEAQSDDSKEQGR